MLVGLPAPEVGLQVAHGIEFGGLVGAWRETAAHRRAVATTNVLEFAADNDDIGVREIGEILRAHHVEMPFVVTVTLRAQFGLGRLLLLGDYEEGDPLPWLSDREADGDATRLGDSVAEGVGRFSGQPVAGVLLLSDFIWNKGEDPGAAARALGRAWRASPSV